MRAITAHLAAAIVMTATVLGGCDTSGPPALTRSFHDAAGRACTVDVEDISNTSKCNVSPTITCMAGTTPCFSVTPHLNDYSDAGVGADLAGAPSQTYRNCAACCDTVHNQTFVDAKTCADIQCATSADCIYQSAMCINGTCH